MRQEDFLTGRLAAERRLQFRMRRLQVHNWGTFSGLHDIAIAESGFLFVGRSGSGKSTLLDAIGALLVPPKWLAFNAAAREGERGRRDRNLASYVRGAWADQKDTGSGEITTRYLRPRTTWSALALTFANQNGREVTLIHLYWLRGAGSANADVKRHYMIAERGFDIASELNDFELDVRALKRRLPDVDHFQETFAAYSERFRRLMDINDEMALKLLHKTQSAKNLGDLNSFLREFMLERPETFDSADRLVAEFAALDAAHQAVVTARRQVETLQPARDAHERLETVRGEIIEREDLLLAIDPYRDQVRDELLTAEIDTLTIREQGVAGEQRQQEERLTDLKEQLAALEMEHREQGGAQIEALAAKKDEAERQREERLTRRGQAESACRELGWTFPDSAAAFAARVGEARGVVESWQATLDQDEARRDALRDEKKQVEADFVETRREVESMERQPSNIPAFMLDLRQRLGDAVGLSDAELPFVGELIEVREDAAEWRGAVERVLHGFALSLLVDARHYSAVSKYVNDTHLGQRLVYYRVGQEAGTLTGRPDPRSLVNKLDLKETTYRAWLQAEFDRRFDYVCVDNLLDFRRERRALTREGQVRHGPDRHEKDDRKAVNDRRHWVLGFDNRDKLQLYRERAAELGARIGTLDQQLRELKNEQKAQQARFTACHTLSNLTWQDIDVAALLDRVQELERQIDALRHGNRELQALGERISKLREAVDQAQGVLDDTRVTRKQLTGDLNRYRKDLTEVRARRETNMTLSPEQTGRLAERFRAQGEATLDNLADHCRQVVDALHKETRKLEDERGTLTKNIERAFETFKREWPQAGADFDATLGAAPDFLALLQRLERDGLPQHEQRFFDMLKEQSSENLAALNARLQQARNDIFNRMDVVNEGLADAEFNTGTHLRIDVTDRHLPDVREFRDQVKAILGYAWQMNRAEAENRFLTLRGLVRRLGGQEPEDQRWREQVLDVRLHVEFVGREFDESEQEVEVYRSGAGKSGGQREKLATTCLAAALRYQLGGADGDLPIYAAVVLDEAFGKADNEFTELAMKIFEKFGFQMIVATPLKSVMTLEPFIGGACFVNIADRQRSAVLPIEYDQIERRLRLPERADGESIPA
ncbi:MAG TPA: SbcC/MukB-like Walker B domain-containing protein [Gammaproteobacteria bacterium]|nr:SbcC/MukB-like Walker B domain-containing protein [Gammaproteobacteria bacterium]